MILKLAAVQVNLVAVQDVLAAV